MPNTIYGYLPLSVPNQYGAYGQTPVVNLDATATDNIISDCIITPVNATHAIREITSSTRNTFKNNVCGAGTTATYALLSGSVLITIGTGSPETVVPAPVGSQFIRTDGGAATSFYVKETGTGNTGWVGK